jgi:GrpB-like predicted nucleotidyltransferase (UPF0157 family)
MFTTEQELLLSIVGEYVCGAIEHVGSTAVAGLSAKPVIDIMMGVESLNASKETIPLLKNAGYCYNPYKADVMHWFCKPTPEIRTHHLHLIPFESDLWNERLAFREFLRGSPSWAAEYVNLKQELARKHANDREAYTQGKGCFIQNILDYKLGKT